MAAGPPNFRSESETVWNTSTEPKTASVTVVPGDLLVVFGMTEDAANTLNTPTGGSLTYSPQQTIAVASYCTNYLWTAPCTASATFDVSVDKNADVGGWYGFNVLQFAATKGVGASAKTNVASGAPSLAVTTLQDNSALVVSNADWTAADGASRAWRTPTGATAISEQTYFRDSSHYTVYGGYHADAGAVGSKTVGLTAPTGQKYSIIVCEILGWSKPPVLVASHAVMRAGSW